MGNTYDNPRLSAPCMTLHHQGANFDSGHLLAFIPCGRFGPHDLARFFALVATMSTNRSTLGSDAFLTTLIYRCGAVSHPRMVTAYVRLQMQLWGPSSRLSERAGIQ